MERLLARKASDLRRGAISLLLQQPGSERRASADRLAASSDALMRQAGLEMLEAIRAPRRRRLRRHSKTGSVCSTPPTARPPPRRAPGCPCS